MKKTMTLITLTTASILLAACGSAIAEPRPSNTPSFKAGQTDGCSTAQGSYTKNSEAFKMDREYNDGWFYGRKHCNPSQS